MFSMLFLVSLLFGALYPFDPYSSKKSKMSVFVTQQNANPDNDLIREGKLVTILVFCLLSLYPSPSSCLGDVAAICKAISIGGLF